jgi:hypothetical protein
MARQPMEQAMHFKGAGTEAQVAADTSVLGQLIKQAAMMSFHDAFDRHPGADALVQGVPGATVSPTG